MAGGALIALVGIAELVIPRARFTTADPAPNATTDSAPSFDRPLHPSSYALVWRVEPGHTTRVDEPHRLDAGEAALGRLDVGLRPSLASGLYEVEWHVRTPLLYVMPWGTKGRFYFGVRAPVPQHLRARQWDEGSIQRGTRIDARIFLVLAGAICIVVGLRSAGAW